MSSWRLRLQSRVDSGRPTALTVADVHTGPTDLWRGVLAWVEAFRAAGLVAGDRLVVALPSGPQAAVVALAALWEGLTLAPVPPGEDPVPAAATYDPHAGVLVEDGRAVPWAFRLTPGGVEPPSALRPAGPPTPTVRVLAPAASVPSWVALSDVNLTHVVDGVLGALRPDEGRWLSVLPWWRSDGILLDLLPGVLGAGEVVRAAIDDPTAAEVAVLFEDRRPTHTVLPLTLVRDLVDHWGGAGPLADLDGGIASGGGLDAALAAVLAGTRLRVHRGAPELSHLVTLGEPGAWRPGVLGRPVGCTLEDDFGGAKSIRGKPLCYGTWHDGELTVEDPGRALRVTFS